jgi:multiple sugar transport system ATP-binding protein
MPLPPTPNQPTRLAFNHVSKRYDAATILNDISLTIEPGEFVVVVGPSGCGKSTLLRLVAGLETLTDGTISLGDTVINHLSPKDRDIAMVFQNYALYPHMSVFDNMAFGLKMRKTPKATILQKVNAVAELLELTPLLKRTPKQLSGGQRQRVALGRAIVRQPKVFLMDEPLSNLDARLRLQMRHELAQLHKQLSTTTLYVTHDQTEALTLGQRVIVLNQGVLQQVATPTALYQRPANPFVANFIGQMNLWPVQLRDGQLWLTPPADAPDASQPLPLAWPTDVPVPALPTTAPLLMGFRPEVASVSPVVVDNPTATPEAMLVAGQPPHTSFIYVRRELLGAEQLLYLAHPLLNGQSTTVRCPVQGALAELSPDTPCQLAVPTAALHWFDAEQQSRLL